VAVTYLPTVIAACLAVPFGIINTHAQRMQPFRAIAARGGGPGPDTLTLSFQGTRSVTAPFAQAFARGEPVPLLAGLGAWLSSLLAPLAAEAVGFKVHGVYTHLDIHGWGIAPGPARALAALLVALLLLLAAFALALRRWETGVRADRWAVAAVAALSLSAPLRARLDGDLEDADLEDHFRLAVFDAAADGDGDGDGAGEPCYEYGIVPVEDEEAPGAHRRGTTATAAPGARPKARRCCRWRPQRHRGRRLLRRCLAAAARQPARARASPAGPREPRRRGRGSRGAEPALRLWAAGRVRRLGADGRRGRGRRQASRVLDERR